MIDLNKGFCEEDLKEIEKIKQQIDTNKASFECLLAIRPTLQIRVGEEGTKIRQQDGGKYYFYTEEDVVKGLSEFINDEYVRSLMARYSYIYDEDEEFEEVFPTMEILGLAKKGRKYVESNLLKVLFKVLPFGEHDPLTGMPVHIESVMLVAE
jgi:hypothetical protein